MNIRKNILNNMISKINSMNLVENSCVEDITYLQNYLENIKNEIQIKAKKQCPLDFGVEVNDYHNPYEHGPKKRSLGSLARGYHVDHNPETISHIRNINVESLLKQREATRNPGQKLIIENDRFDYLPRGALPVNNIVWDNDMPRGGVSTRGEKFHC